MYTLKVSYGYLVDELEDERETETTEILGTYEDEEEARKAAEDKFYEVIDLVADPCETRIGEAMRSPYRYYVTYGAIDEYGTVVCGYNHYYEISVKEDCERHLNLAELLKKYLDGMDVIAVKRYGNEYIVMYHDERNVCTPYIIHQLNDSGLYSGRYYANEEDAKKEF